MSKADPRLSSLATFTKTRHGPQIPENLTSSLPLPPDFTVLILGASEGIGEHLAYAYARAGASRIILAARRLEPLHQAKTNIQQIVKDEQVISPVKVDTYTVDIASSTSMQALRDFVMENVQGNLDCLILNAAYAPPVTLKMTTDTPADVQRAFDVNAMGTFHAAHFFIPMLLGTQNGTNRGAKQFITVGSMANSIRRGHIANMGYCVSKLAQTRIVEYAMEQYSDQGLWSVIVHPGAVNTAMAKGNTPDSFVPYLVDHVGLAGAFCVRLSRERAAGDLAWLNGRFVSANWDYDELMAREGEVVERDLLKFSMAV